LAHNEKAKRRRHAVCAWQRPLERFVGHSFCRWNSEIFTDFLGEEIVDFRMAWNSGPSVQVDISPPRMTASFSQELASMIGKMAQELPTFQT
jgi:hypothetical protein